MDLLYLFITSGILVVLGFLTLLNNPKQKQSTFFFLISILIVAWIWSNYLSNETTAINSALLYNKLIFVFTSLLLFCLYLFSTVYPVDRSNEKKDIPLLILTIFIILIDFSPLLVTSINLYSNHSSISFGYGIVFYLIHFATQIILFSINIIRSYREAEGVERIKIQYLLLGISFSLVGAIITNLILPIFLGEYNFSNVGPAFLIFFIAFTTISMMKYRLFGVKFLLAQILKIILLTIIPFLCFYLLLWIINSLSWNVYMIRSSSLVLTGSLLFSIIYSFVINKSQNIFFGKFAHGGVNPQYIINKYNRDIGIELNIDKLSKRIISIIKDIFYVKHIGIYIFEDDDEKPIYENNAGFENNQIDIKELNLLVQYWRKMDNNSVIIRSEIKKDFEKNNDKLNEQIYLLMVENKTNAIIPLNRDAHISGLMILGKREDKRDFTVEELRLLNNLVLNTSVAMSRALLYQEVQEFNKTLQQKVDLQTKELQIKVEQLQEARKKESDMIDIMGHELRTPATIVKLNADFLTKFIGEIQSDPLGYQKYVKRIQDSIDSEIKLINTLLSSAKLEGDKIELNPEEVDIKKEIEMSLDGNFRESNDKGIELINQTDINTPRVYADRARVVEILNNLVSNGIKYTEKGSVTINTEYDEEIVKVSIEDTGNGISKEDISQLGQKFYRISNYIESSKDDNVSIVRPGGTGLGLYVTFNLVKKMGGNIWVESELGKGSKFFFTLPRYKGQTNRREKTESKDMFERLGLK